ncbi:MAG TPA: flagellar export chaperone FliS [Verrucomicrobiales bacterium]|nr:flagellar export chaperone FliS [Verrucomicrobiales bacterium]|tara:strand:- start:478 stop:969 length:492 start_codon:yes stop_codon:yes gene_type:complete
MDSANKLNAYRANAVGSASPESLVVMLYDGAIRFLGAALRAFEHDDPLDFNLTVHTNITKTQEIIRELNHALDLENGGELGQSLTSLYYYFDQRLQEANIKKDRAIIEEILSRISELRDAWSESLEKQKNLKQQAGLSPEKNNSQVISEPSETDGQTSLSLLG